MIAKFVLTFALIGAIQALPWEPIPREDANWYNQHNSFVNNTISRGDDINVLFYGDSITAGWGGAGKPVYDKEYAPLGTANYGIGGDKTENVLWRIINGEVEGLHPKVIVLKIGTNNGGDSQDDVVRGITAIVEELRSRLPNAKILLLGVLPRSDTDAWYRRVNDINIKIARLDDGVNIHFLDMFNQFSVGWAQVDQSLFNPDKLHLVQAGYQKWADTQRKLFTKLLNA
jgi:lysophospholipase L1-like esterase